LDTGSNQKQLLGPKLTAVWDRGATEHPKKFGIAWFISATIRAMNFKFGIGLQLGFGESITKNKHLGQNWWGSGLAEDSKKLGPLTHFCNH